MNELVSIQRRLASYGCKSAREEDQAGATYESFPLAFPFPSSVTSFDLPSAFAGKMHALLCREYVKGRDWYDFITAGRE